MEHSTFLSPLLINSVAGLLAYLLGSIPFAVVSAKIFGLADPRTYGSGNPGATNVLRTGNKKAALVTLAGDILKGTLAVLLARFFELSLPGVSIVALCAFLGHIFPVFLRFKGGKGVATAGGIFLALEPLSGLFALLVWLLVVALTRYSSLSALAAAFSVPVFSFILNGTEGHVVVLLTISLIVVYRHKTNIQRILQGKETRIGKKTATPQKNQTSPPSEP